MGLAGMAERAREFGWITTIDSQPGQGTRVKVSEL
jgi:signal transduction histidine kinase